MTQSLIMDFVDTVQPNNYWCWPSEAMSAGLWWNVGPKKLGDWAKDLNTTEKHSTNPETVAAYFSDELNCEIEYRQYMTIDDLRRFAKMKWPVLLAVKEYMSDPKIKASKEYGHCLTSLLIGDGWLVVHDPSEDNLVMPRKNNSLNAPGRAVIFEKDFLDNWKDRDYIRLGIAIGPKKTTFKADTKAETKLEDKPPENTEPAQPKNEPNQMSRLSDAQIRFVLGNSNSLLSEAQLQFARDPNKPRKFASTQVNLPKELADKLYAIAAKIPDDDLADDGRDDESHITLVYGLEDKDRNAVEKLVKDFGPVEIKLGKISLFHNAEKEFDVVKVEVESSGLHKLNKLIADNIEHHSTYPKYVPHVTISYVKPGAGDSLVGQHIGGEFIAHSFLFCPKDRSGKIEIQLGKAQKKKSASKLSREQLDFAIKS